MYLSFSADLGADNDLRRGSTPHNQYPAYMLTFFKEKNFAITESQGFILKLGFLRKIFMSASQYSVDPIQTYGPMDV